MIEAHTNGTTMFLQFMLTICSVSIICGVASAQCPMKEYRAGTECCPACPAGQQVYEDCKEKSLTKCTNCTKGTFQEGHNVQKQCSTCTKCDAGLGLKVKKSCTSTSDALCEPLDGYFCSDSNRGGCMAAQRHTVCSPGQYISQRGTADKDTECLQCTDGTFSDGTTLCQNHTICESVGPVQIKPGTDSTDSECGERGSHRGHVAGIIPGIILVMVIIAIILRKKIKEWYDRRQKNTEYEPVTTQQNSSDCPAPTRMDDHDDAQSHDPAPASSATHNGSVSIQVHPENDPLVLFRRVNGASQSSLLSLVPPSTSQSIPLSLVPSSTSQSSLLSLVPPSTSQAACRSYVRSVSVSSYFEVPRSKLPIDRVSLLKGNDIEGDEVMPVLEILDQPEGESEDSNSEPFLLIRRDNGASQLGLLSLVPPSTSQAACRSVVRSKSVSSYFKVPRSKLLINRGSLLKGNDITEEEVTPFLEILDQPESESEDSNSDTRGV